MVSRLFLFALVAPPAPLYAAQLSAANHINPIRKVVTLLQTMQKKVIAEGEKEEELYKKFMCYCRSSSTTLTDGISAGEAKVGELGTGIKEAQEQKAQLEDGLKQDQTDRAAAKKSMADATAQRNKEAAEFANMKAESDANIDAINAAVAALEQGMGMKDSRLAYSKGYRSTAGGEGVAPAVLQSDKARTLRKLLTGSVGRELADDDRQAILSFLSGPPGFYIPQSDQIVGILKQMGDEMDKGLADATAQEDAAIKSYKAMMAAKMKEVAALTAAIEAKLKKIGELGVSIASMENELGDTEEALLEDTQFLADLKKGCATKTAETQANMKLRAQELAALSETIKVLNDDDALDLFKKTLPSASASFLQVGTNSAAMRASALAALKSGLGRALLPDRARLDLLSLALHGKKIGFEKVIAMIDEMVATLKKEQVDDDNKKEYCAIQMDISDDKKKSLERSISDEDKAIAITEDGISTTTEEIAALKAAIKALDKEVMEATEQRKGENAAYKDLMASDSAAKELLEYAKNRLNKFYNPKLYKAKGVSAAQVAPPPPPETVGPYQTKSAENAGVIDMINILINDLDKDMTEAETTEKDAQADYEVFMADSAQQRTTDSKTLTDKTAAKAALEGELEAHNNARKSLQKELEAHNNA